MIEAERREPGGRSAEAVKAIVAYLPFLVAPVMPWILLSVVTLVMGWVIMWDVRRDGAVVTAALATVGSYLLFSLFRFQLTT